MDCIIYGVGSTYVCDVQTVLDRLGWRVLGGVANVEGSYEPPDLEPIVSADRVPDEWLKVGAVVGLFTPGYRAVVEAEARERGFSSFPAVIDPTALSSAADVGEGTIVNARVTVGAGSEVGRFVAVNRTASIAHHVTLEDYASVGPGSVLCGHVRVGRGAVVGAGAVVAPETTIGENAVVAAGAVVMREVPAHTLVIGNPARAVKHGIPGYHDVGVASAPAR